MSSLASPMQQNLNGNISSQFGPNQITDLLISNLIISKMGDLMNNNFTISFSNIIKILILLSIGEIKNWISLLFNEIIKLIKLAPTIVIPFLYKLLQFIKLVKPKNNFEKINNSYQENIREIIIDIDVCFMTSLYMYLKKNKNCSFKEKLTRVEIKNNKENIFQYDITNIKINLRNSIIIVDTFLQFGINMYYNEVEFFSTNNNKNRLINSYLDLLTEQQKEIISKIYNYLINNKYPGEIGIIERFNKLIDIKCHENTFSENTIADLLIKKYKNLQKNKTQIEITITSCILYKFFSFSSITDSFNSLKKNGTMLFDRENFYDFDSVKFKLIKSYTCDFYIELFSSITPLELKNDDIKLAFNNLRSSPSQEKNSKNSLHLHIQSDEKDDNKIVKNFIEKIYGSYKKNTNKIKIHSLRLEEEKIINEKPNPDYDIWKQKKEIIDQLKLKENNNSMEILSFLNQQIPLNTIVTEVINKKIVSSQLNEISKNIDTLYLRKKDKEKLLNSLSQFRDNKTVLSELGLQNKLNILLYGNPGTGKSTTIQAVATYLQKDIYYIDLQKVLFNEDLQVLFEFVNKNVQKGGIIVIEDIDAMTNVVLKRQVDISEYKINDLINNQKSKLSLEYLLNILQGTLTIDDSIFIVTTNHIDHLDPAFYRDGRFDVKIELKLCNHYQIKCIYFRMLKKELPEDIIRKISENKYSPASIIYHIKNHIFDSDIDPEIIMKPFLN